MKNYWLMKSEPGAYSIDDLQKDRRTHWDGVRNYQARNLMRDQIKLGDKVLFYHSNTQPPGVIGVAFIVREGYPDYTAFDPRDPHYDPKSKRESPRWYMVDIEFEKKLPRLISLPELRMVQELEEMVLLKRSRLSVQPVRPSEFRTILELSRQKHTI